jgi:hypothetical protein
MPTPPCVPVPEVANDDDKCFFLDPLSAHPDLPREVSVRRANDDDEPLTSSESEAPNTVPQKSAHRDSGRRAESSADLAAGTHRPDLPRRFSVQSADDALPAPVLVASSSVSIGADCARPPVEDEEEAAADRLCRVDAQPQLILARFNASNLLALYPACGGLQIGGAHLTPFHRFTGHTHFVQDVVLSSDGHLVQDIILSSDGHFALTNYID